MHSIIYILIYFYNMPSPQALCKPCCKLCLTFSVLCSSWNFQVNKLLLPFTLIDWDGCDSIVLTFNLLALLQKTIDHIIYWIKFVFQNNWLIMLQCTYDIYIYIFVCWQSKSLIFARENTAKARFLILLRISFTLEQNYFLCSIIYKAIQ